jgi:Tol biopolymer transport system component
MHLTLRTAVIVTFAVGLAASQGMLAQSSRTADVQFKAAQHQEEVVGDLTGAIEQYKKIARGRDRSIAAKALVRMAECYEKLGQSDAQKTYERVVREFADQTESAAAARARLASMRHAPATGNDMSFRRVGDGSQNEHGAAVSYDGRYIAHHLHPDTLGTLAARELATGKVRPLVVRAPDSRDQPDLSVISRDSKTVAFAWGNPEATYGYELRTIPLQTSSPGQPRRLFRSEDVRATFPYDWSPDGTQIAVVLTDRDRTARIGLVSSADGSLTVLKSVDSRFATNNKMSFSPDGKYLAYDLAQVDNSEQRDVFVMAVDGSRDIAAVAHPSYNALAGWSPDGTHLLFFSDRTGSRGLWRQAIVDGRPQGAAALIKADLGSARSLGITASGALYVSSSVLDMDIEVIPVDFATGQIVGSPAKPITSYMGANSQPEWSSDGRFMSYVSRREGRLVLAMRELATGNARVISPQLSTIASKAWSPDRKCFAIQGSDLKGRRGLFLVDADTGEVSALVAAGITATDGVAWSPDGKKLYHGGRIDRDRAFFERDMVSGTERAIIRRTSLSIHISLSPDGRWIATMTADAAGQAAIVFPVSGGEPRELMRTNQTSLAIALWAPDSNSVVVKRGMYQDRWVEPIEYWQVPISGGEPRRTDLKINSATSPQWTWPRLHPDGRQVAYTTATERKDEVWVLEHFLPRAGAPK